MSNSRRGNMRKTILALFLFLSLMAVVLSPGCNPLQPPTATTGNAKLEAVDDAWNAIVQQHIDKANLDQQKLSQAAIEGMLKELNDPYAAYLSARDYQFEIGDLQGKFEGIGAQVSLDNGQIVLTPLSGNPAEAAGIKPGDKVLEIDGQSTAGLSPAEATLKIRGKKGTQVQLLVQHPGEDKPVLITIVRQEIKMTTVSYKMQGDIAYIYIHYFSGLSDTELEPIFKGLGEQGAKGIIIDLRNNPGGPVDTAVKISSYFIKDGVILYTQDNLGRRTPWMRASVPFVTDLPLVVLVNQYSASASEIIAGAVQDTKRGAIMGTKTYGKGSVDTFAQLSDGSAIYFTIGRWLTPNGNLIEGKGITPDVESTLEGDAQVQKAIDYLHGKTAAPAQTPTPAAVGA